MFAILGSGFGLYGYMPAIIDGLSERVVLPERYRPRFSSRPELAKFGGEIAWVPSEADALKLASGVVLALRPVDQMHWIPKCLAEPGIEHLLLEKPLATSPLLANQICERLIESGKNFRIGYLFRYTGWGRKLASALSAGERTGQVRILWRFMAHHNRLNLATWKRVPDEGGGVIRFYGIHLIALLAELGYREVKMSQAFGNEANEPEKWVSVFSGAFLPDLNIEIDTNSSAELFQLDVEKATGVAANKCNTYSLSSPFELTTDSTKDTSLDSRVPDLIQLARSLRDGSSAPRDWYTETIKLWKKAEDRLEFFPQTSSPH
jgi:hypothetical protein